MSGEFKLVVELSEGKTLPLVLAAGATVRDARDKIPDGSVMIHGGTTLARERANLEWYGVKSGDTVKVAGTATDAKTSRVYVEFESVTGALEKQYELKVPEDFTAVHIFGALYLQHRVDFRPLKLLIDGGPMLKLDTCLDRRRQVGLMVIREISALLQGLQPTDDPFSVFGKLLTGNTKEFKVTGRMTTLDLKHLVHDKCGFPAAQQILIADAQELADELPLAFYKLLPEHTFHIVLNLRGS